MNIYFSTLDVETITEVKKYDGAFSYLGALGGAVSLYLGASFITCFEVFEFMIRLVISIFI